ncbi:MAG: AEC family transporter [Oscillospiraceae bacterium]|nr:AEC family transporter [Oscillospiraceae bacterium]
MIESFLSVGTQVLILFLMIGTGFVLGKLHLITHKGVVSMSNLLMYVVSPCILIVVFQRPLETETFHNFWVALLAALVIHGINILVSELVIRDRDPMRKSFFRFSAIFSNCGFMAVPLQTAILGSLGVFYGSAYLLVFTVLTWTLGIQLVKGGKMAFSWRTLLMNPGVTLAVVIAASTPPAALLGMFAAKFDRDVSLAPSLVAVQTLLSMITMPLVLGLAKFLV